MPGKQVFYRKAYHGQAKMDPLPIDLKKIAVALQIEKRYGSILQQERKIASRSLEDVAKTFSIGAKDLMSWENGQSSPPANIFYAIIQSYGRKATHRVAKFDLQVQIERYDLILAAQYQNRYS